MQNYSPSVALWFFILTSTFCLLYCGENEIQASLISSASVDATPTPATNIGRCSGCRSVKPVSQTTVGSDDWSVTSTSHPFSSRS